MKILIDGISLEPKMKGVGKYTFNILKNLAKMDKDSSFYITILKKTLKKLLPQNKSIQYIYVPYKNHFVHGFHTLPSIVKKINPDLVWIPYDTPVKLNKPYFISCHGIPKKIREIQKKNEIFSFKNYIRDAVDEILLKKTLQKARVVFANSNYIKDYLKKSGINPNKIVYAPCAPSFKIKSIKRIKYPPYILFFYTGCPEENFKIVPKVYQRIMNSNFPYELVIAGVPENLISKIKNSFSKFPWKSKVRILPFIEDEEKLIELYSNASLYLDLSLEEGFGMQVIEAMACKTPVVCSNRGALPEITDNSALLVNPEDSEEISLKIKKILEDKKLRERLVKKAYQQSKKFSWEKTAEIVYREILKSKKIEIWK